jgi:hypothetical protein
MMFGYESHQSWLMQVWLELPQAENKPVSANHLNMADRLERMDFIGAHPG